jgi:hypothetical protein
MDLLSAAQRLQIRLALKDVTDTFMKTPISYTLVGQTFDRFMENGESASTTVELLGMVEFMDENRDHNEVTEGGSTNTGRVKATLNLEDLEALDLITPEYTFIGNTAVDYFTTQNEDYKVEHIMYDGALDQKNVLVVIYGIKVAKN